MTPSTKPYWQTGKRIVEEEQHCEARAEYGKQLLKQLSVALTTEFGKGFSVQNLYYFRQFYVVFPEIFHTPCGNLTWSHYRWLLSVSNEAAFILWTESTVLREVRWSRHGLCPLTAAHSPEHGSLRAAITPKEIIYTTKWEMLRSDRDSNSGTACDGYTLSRRASSATRAPLLF